MTSKEEGRIRDVIPASLPRTRDRSSRQLSEVRDTLLRGVHLTAHIADRDVLDHAAA
jgi:hypothetical protein